MHLQNQLLQAEAEIKKGQKLKAVNRLRNVINSCPDAMEARAVLAQLYYDAGFYDAAVFTGYLVSLQKIILKNV